MNELPTPNLPLLRKILDHIDAHPEEWSQANWFTPTECGTAFCVAGHAVAMTEGVIGIGGWMEPASGEGWQAAGRRALGLTAEEADDFTGLFGANNTRADVQRWAEAIAARAGERL